MKDLTNIITYDITTYINDGLDGNLLTYWSFYDFLTYFNVFIYINENTN